MKYTFVQLAILFGMLFAATLATLIWLPDQQGLHGILILALGTCVGLFFKSPAQ